MHLSWCTSLCDNRQRGDLHVLFLLRNASELSLWSLQILDTGTHKLHARYVERFRWVIIGIESESALLQMPLQLRGRAPK